MSKLTEWADELVVQEALGIRPKKYLVYSQSLAKEMDTTCGGEVYIKALHIKHAQLIVAKEMRKDSVIVSQVGYEYG